MAKNDIRSSRPASGGTQHITAYPLAAAQTFDVGEVVFVASSGELTECSTDPDMVVGITAGSSQGKDVAGNTGTRPTGTLIQVFTATDEQVFETRNFATDGAGTAVTPTLANVGDFAGFSLAGGAWFLDTGTATHHCEIIEVLDRNGAPLGDSTSRSVGAGVTVRFVFI